MKPGQPIRKEDYGHACQRAKACLARHIKDGKVPKPETCDGCGEGSNELRRLIFDPFDALTFSVYCDSCWIDHHAERTLRARKANYAPLA